MGHRRTRTSPGRRPHGPRRPRRLATAGRRSGTGRSQQPPSEGPAPRSAAGHGPAPADMRRGHGRLPGGLPLFHRAHGRRAGHRRRPGRRSRRHGPHRPIRQRRTPDPDMADRHHRRCDRLRAAPLAHRQQRRCHRTAGGHRLRRLLRPVHRVREAADHRPPGRPPAGRVRPGAAAGSRSADAVDGHRLDRARAAHRSCADRLAGAGLHHPGLLAVLHRYHLNQRRGRGYAQPCRAVRGVRPWRLRPARTPHPEFRPRKPVDVRRTGGSLLPRPPHTVRHRHRRATAVTRGADEHGFPVSADAGRPSTARCECR
ncbi:hypothetical protein QF026_000295 [Streptomyces aurantiacus]|nr:hypothetical protein [Streptomyces aurantiacus]